MRSVIDQPDERSVDERLVASLCRAAENEPGHAEDVVRSHVRRLAPLADAIQSERLVRAAVARLDGLGALDALLQDGTVDEVLVNAGGEIWVECHGNVERRGDIAADDLAVVIERILAPLGRRLDRTTPIVDARLADGTRVCVVVPPISIGGTCLSMRRFRSTPLPLDAFAPQPVAAVLAELIERRCNVVVSGATSSGKTSLLSSLLGLIPRGERVVMLEDTAELAPAIDHVVRLEARPATNDGVAAVTLERLLHTALRLRPDRLVVGEVRGPDVLLTDHASRCERALARTRLEGGPSDHASGGEPEERRFDEGGGISVRHRRGKFGHRVAMVDVARNGTYRMARWPGARRVRGHAFADGLSRGASRDRGG